MTEYVQWDNMVQIRKEFYRMQVKVTKLLQSKNLTLHIHDLKKQVSKFFNSYSCRIYVCDSEGFVEMTYSGPIIQVTISKAPLGLSDQEIHLLGVYDYVIKWYESIWSDK